MRRLAVAMAVVGLSSPAQADILHQDIAVDLTEPDVVSIELEATLEFASTTGSFDFILPPLPVLSAHVDGMPATVAPHPLYPNQLLRITFAGPLPAAQQGVLRVVLEGPLDCTSGFCGRSSSETYFTVGTPGAAWYLADPFASDAFTGSVSIDVPEGHVAVSGVGAPTVTPTLSGQQWTYAWDHPLELIGLYAGEPEAIASSDGRVTAYFNPSQEEASLIEEAVTVAADVLPIFEELFGPLPVHQVGLTALPTNVPFGALGMLANVYFNGVVFTGDGYLVRQGVAHELAHSWWGNLADGDGEGRSFFGEAMAEHSAWRALGILDGDEVRTSGMRMNATWYQYRRPSADDASIIAVPQDSPLFIFVTYHKGAMALRVLETEAGAPAYDAAMRRFLARGPGGLTFDGLRDDFAAESDVDVERWKNQWVDRPGFPHLRVGGQRNGSTMALDIDVLDDWRLHLPLHVVRADGAREVIFADVVPGPQRVELPGLDVVAVEVDPRWTMAREVQSTLPADVTFDGEVDGADLMDIALRQGSYLPATRRVDGGFDPLYDINGDAVVDDADLQAVSAAANP